ncbi:tRNA pseudouridine(55) synthase [Kwoniella shandongensis]|uniref:tRNA pseudouridine(55) synthase n=1 Tax=Kwoniella shandongensis TaxID=1734106 RepID=A0A5M6C9L7_9TREE|nr:tRNA pseudouridine(55) synthase [Kwoniella shandongensis]KAA5530095.1 tRNA pseudouridine(55) synthase [Kwoniella shandongensis]
MPKAASTPSLPLNGLFPIAKPSGPSSMKCIDSITPLLLDSRLFDDPVKRSQPQSRNKRKKNLTHMGLKIGQGGTLDPLADGVLVIGVNRGTKHLNQFLECSKEYESIGLLGATTTSFDSHDPVISTASWEHVTKEDIEKVLDQFRGEILQTPPIFSALKMDGKPLYEYAREGKPLPRPIPVRKCQVSIDLVDFRPASVAPGDGGHEYHWPTERLDAEGKKMFRKLTDIVSEAQHKGEGAAASAADAEEEAANNNNADSAVPTTTTGEGEDAKVKVVEPLMPDLEAPDYPEISPKTGLRPPTFTVRMTVSSGTYVRSIVHDIGVALGCGAHVVKLTRTRQGEFSLHGDEEVLSAISTASPEVGTSKVEGGEESSLAIPDGPTGGCVPWNVWERAIADHEAEKANEEKERKEAIASGMSAEDIHMYYSKEAVEKKKREGELKEWEKEVLRRFKPVPVPINGGHGFHPV